MTVTHADYRLSQLDQLEAESIHIFREVAAEFEKPVLMFSGGKDSIVMMRLAEKAFFPAKIPFPVLQVDTGYDFPEVLACRDNWVNRLGVRLIVASVEEAMANGVVVDDGKTSRNRLQIGTLLNALEEGGFTAAFGGGRRDEEKARAKERVYSHRDEFGQWDPKMQRPELWSLYNGRIHEGEHMRIFPISNWTELDIWDYIGREGIEIPSIYFSHQRRVFERDGMLLSESEFNPTREGETVEERTVRFRTVGDLTLTGCVESEADTIDKIIDGDRRGHRHRAWRHPWRRPLLRGRHGGPEEGGLLLMADNETPVPEPSAAMRPAPLRHRRLRRRRQVDPDRPAAARLQVDLRRPAGGRRGDLASRRATTTPTWRCSPTACAPSASRASPSTWPTATSRRRTASSSSPTPRATCSTRATWSPAPPPPTSAWCSSTPARGSPSSPAGTR